MRESEENRNEIVCSMRKALDDYKFDIKFLYYNLLNNKLKINKSYITKTQYIVSILEKSYANSRKILRSTINLGLMAIMSLTNIIMSCHDNIIGSGIKFWNKKMSRTSPKRKLI